MSNCVFLFLCVSVFGWVGGWVCKCESVYDIFLRFAESIGCFIVMLLCIVLFFLFAFQCISLQSVSFIFLAQTIQSSYSSHTLSYVQSLAFSSPLCLSIYELSIYLTINLFCSLVLIFLSSLFSLCTNICWFPNFFFHSAPSVVRVRIVAVCFSCCLVIVFSTSSSFNFHIYLLSHLNICKCDFEFDCKNLFQWCSGIFVVAKYLPFYSVVCTHVVCVHVNVCLFVFIPFLYVFCIFILRMDAVCIYAVSFFFHLMLSLPVDNIHLKCIPIHLYTFTTYIFTVYVALRSRSRFRWRLVYSYDYFFYDFILKWLVGCYLQWRCVFVYVCVCVWMCARLYVCVYLLYYCYL